MQNFQTRKQQSPVDGWDHQDPEEAFTLPSRYFFDETLFKAERDNIFMHAWHVAGHVSEFAEPGQYVVTDLFDQSVVVAKNRQGQIHAFHNVCQHRGNRLLEERRGTTGGVVRCAYHSWCYEMDGSLRSAPRCEKMKNFELQQFNIPQIRTEELGGFIYFNLDPAAPSLRDLFPGADEEMRRVFPDLANMRLIEEQDVIVPANWKVIMDNSIEGYHFKLSGPCHIDLAKLIDFKGYQLTKRDNWWTYVAPANLSVTEAYGVPLKSRGEPGRMLFQHRHVAEQHLLHLPVLGVSGLVHHDSAGRRTLAAALWLLLHPHRNRCGHRVLHEVDERGSGAGRHCAEHLGAERPAFAGLRPGPLHDRRPAQQ